MSEPRRVSASVVIVGGGPVGLGLAVTLGKAGVSCALVERQPEPSPIPRGQNLSARSMEHFYYWDCADDLRAARLLPPGFPIGGITAYRSLASEYWYAPAGRETVYGQRFILVRPDQHVAWTGNGEPADAAAVLRRAAGAAAS